MTQETQDPTEVTVSADKAKSCIIKVLKANLVPMLHGSPGIGKSDIVHDVAATFYLKVIDLRLGQCDRTDLLGFPQINQETNRAGYAPMNTFPIAGDELPWIDPKDHSKGQYNGWLLFLDEITSADDDVQAAAYKLILDRMVGLYKLHPKVAIVAAGNLETDNAVVNPMSTALQSRMVHLVLRHDVKKWINWAIDHGIDHRITDYMAFKPSSLHNFDPNHNDKTYSCPRTVVFMDRILKVCGGNVHDPDFETLAAGCVTAGVAREFVIFTDIYATLPKMADILAMPLVAPMPTAPGDLYALSGALAAFADKTNIDKLLPYIVRMGVEYQVMVLRYITKRDPSMAANPTIAKWVSTHGKELF